MAERFRDSFDFYSVIADAAAGAAGGGAWDSSANWTLSTTTRFADGRAMGGTTNATCLVRTGLSNQGTLFSNVGFLQTTALGAAGLGKYIQFRDGATAQCSIVYRGDGSIVLTSGGPTGSVLATFNAAFLANFYDGWQHEVVIHDSAGEWHVRKNGALSDSFAATGLNTRGGTANNYANAVALGHSSGTGFAQFFDDFAHWDNSGAVPNDWFPGDLRAIQRMVALDSSVQFSRQTAGSLFFGSNNASNTHSALANIVYVNQPFSATQGGSFSSVTIDMNADHTGNLKIALYEADGDKSTFVAEAEPGRLIAVSNVSNNTPNGNQTVTFPSTVHVVKGRVYMFAVLTDATASIARGPSGGFSYAGTTYAAGFPADLSDLTTATSNNVAINVTLTATNAGVMNDRGPDGATTYAFDGVVGHKDEMTVEALPYTPSAIQGINLRSFNAKSDAAAKTMRIAGDSGGTPFESADHLPATTFGQFNTFLPTDPNTSAAWTPTGFNALKIGPKVQA